MSFLTDIFGALSLTAQIVGAGMRARAAAQQATAERGALLFNAQTALNEADLNEWKARNLVLAAGDEMTQRYLKAAQIKGSQRARFAARGVDPFYGSALNILRDTDYITNLDIETLSSNAAREAWVIARSAQSSRDKAARLRSQASSIDPRMAAFGSLLTDAPKVAQSWLRWREGEK